MKIQVENIKCNGCVATITKELLSIKGTSDVKIELETQTINVAGAEELRPKIIAKLHKFGLSRTRRKQFTRKSQKLCQLCNWKNELIYPFLLFFFGLEFSLIGAATLPTSKTGV